MQDTIASSDEAGSLGVFHLKRLWSASMAARRGAMAPRNGEGELDNLVVQAMGLTLHQTFQHVFREGTTFDAFESWIVATAGEPDAIRVERLNAAITGSEPPRSVREWLQSIDAEEPALSPEDIAFWEKNGYVILRNAVPDAQRADAERAIWRFVGADPQDSSTWYRKHRPEIHGIMVELVQDAAIEANRRSRRIHKAFAQLWGSSDLWYTSDRCGFHPPQREDWPFQGPDLHWDCDLAKPGEFGTQGILYLTDTPPEQGALTLVPGFHRRLAEWLPTIPSGTDPHKQDLHALGSFAVGANAGDMVIWNHLLPHGSRPNLGTRPRVVQYINMFPGPARTTGA